MGFLGKSGKRGPFGEPGAGTLEVRLGRVEAVFTEFLLGIVEILREHADQDIDDLPPGIDNPAIDSPPFDGIHKPVPGKVELVRKWFVLPLFSWNDSIFETLKTLHSG